MLLSLKPSSRRMIARVVSRCGRESVTTRVYFSLFHSRAAQPELRLLESRIGSFPAAVSLLSGFRLLQPLPLITHLCFSAHDSSLSSEPLVSEPDSTDIGLNERSVAPHWDPESHDA